MTKGRIEAYIKGLEKAFPGLRTSNPSLWTNKLALVCYNEDRTVGQKKTKTGPISHDTIGISSTPVDGSFGDEKLITFDGVDLLEGSTLAYRWLFLGTITNQVFVIPGLTDISGIVPIGEDPVIIPPPIVEQGLAFMRLREVNDFYESSLGLKRPGGMVIDSAIPVRADIEALGQWQYQIVLGRTVENIKTQIRHSEEWKNKHPGELPF